MNFTNLKNFIDTLPEYGIPSSDIIVYRDHEELWRHSVGEPLRGDELYNTYSCSKIVTCVAALQLFEQGKFLMKDPISQYLPEFDELYVKKGSFSVDCETPVTFYHLFTMTAGLNYDLTAPVLREVVERTDGRAPTRDFIAALARVPLDFEPGTQFQYSLCHDVLACLVEVISGMTFGEYCKKYIFEPCGMVDSTFIATDEVRARMAPQYRYNDARKKALRVELANPYVPGCEYESGGAGLISSVNDFIKFTDALAYGGVSYLGNRIISEHTLRMMRTNCITDEMKVAFRKKWPVLDGFGYGFGVRCEPELSRGLNASPSEFGWHGAAGSFMIIDPETRTSLFYAQHMLNNKERYVHPRIRHCFYSGF